MKLLQNIYRNDENKCKKFFFNKKIKKIKIISLNLFIQFDYCINLNNYFSKKHFF